MLSGNFVQVGPDGSKSEGEFYLQKPGKVRFDYNPPSPIELIADGRRWWCATASSRRRISIRCRRRRCASCWPTSIDLMRDTNLIGVYADDVFVTVVIEERQILAGTTA